MDKSCRTPLDCGSVLCIQVLELMSCDCRRKCVTETYSCIELGMECRDEFKNCCNDEDEMFDDDLIEVRDSSDDGQE